MLELVFERELAGRSSAAISPARRMLATASSVVAVPGPIALIIMPQPSATAFSQALAEHAEQALALVAGREDPAILDAHRADRQAGGAHQVEHGGVRQAALGAALEVDAAQLDGVEAARFGGRQAPSSGVVSTVQV